MSITFILAGCATQSEMRTKEPIYSKVVTMSLSEARDCVSDHWRGGLYGKSVTPYRDGYRIRNSGGHIAEFIEVQPSDKGTVISVYSSVSKKVSGYSYSPIKKCSGIE